jgi:hypothetical protein
MLIMVNQHKVGNQPTLMSTNIKWFLTPWSQFWILKKKSTSKSKQELQPFFFAKNAIYICQNNFPIFEFFFTLDFLLGMKYEN